MKNKAGKILLLILLTCSSCSSIYRFSIDVQEPALVTLPISAQNVLILNNTVAQPENYGIDRTFEGRPVSENFPLLTDSLIWSAMDEIAGVLNESNFFNTISIYRKSLRTDKEWLSKAYLSPEEQSDFYDAGNCDALLVIERLLFSVNENVKKINTGSLTLEPAVYVDLRSEGMITCSMYAYGREKPLTTFSVSDTLYVKSTVINDSTILFKEIPEFVLDELSRSLGNKAATYFIPTWKTEKRFLFVSYNSRMQEAAGYAADQKWANAESIWVAELEKKTKPADRSKISFNLAVANEMQDRLELALELAQKAKEYLTKANPNNDYQEIELTDEYIATLQQRIQNNRLLDLQWGKE